MWNVRHTELTIEYGMSGFILASDKATAIKRCGNDNGPIVREHVTVIR